MTKRSWIIHLGCRSTEDVEPLIDLPHKKKAGIAGNLCTWKSMLMEQSNSGLMVPLCLSPTPRMQSPLNGVDLGPRLFFSCDVDGFLLLKLANTIS